MSYVGEKSIKYLLEYYYRNKAVILIDSAGYFNIMVNGLSRYAHRDVRGFEIETSPHILTKIVRLGG